VAKGRRASQSFFARKEKFYHLPKTDQEQDSDREEQFRIAGIIVAHIGVAVKIKHCQVPNQAFNESKDRIRLAEY